MVSLKDIAKQCGVSVATVSKALNHQSDIGEATAERIRTVANEMGYFPNAAARTLKTRRTADIGVLYSDEAGIGLTHEYFSGVLNGFKMQAEELGYDITFLNATIENKRMSYLEHCHYRNVDGVVIVCADFNSADVQALMNSDFPVATIDYIHPNCTSVGSDNVRGMEELLHYILKMGHRRVAYVHGQAYSYVTKERLSTFYRVFMEQGIDVPEDYIRPAQYLKIEEAERQTEELLALSQPPTCILYPDDTALIGGLNVIHRKGLSIPEDISVAGYDGTMFSQLLYPKLTTLKQDTNQIGREAARRLIARIEQPKISLAEQVVISGRLLEGQSVGKI